MSWSPEKQDKLERIIELAESQGRDDVVQKAYKLMSDARSTAADKMQGMAAAEEAAKPNPLIEKAERIKKLALEQGREDIASKVDSIIMPVKYDESDITEEIRGFGGIPAEQATFGVLGDEFRAGARATIAKVADAVGGTDYAGTWDEEYSLALEDERRVEQETYDEFPVAANAIGIVYGVVAPGAAAVRLGVGTTALQGAVRQGGFGVAGGATYGFMEGEGSERLTQAVSLGAIGGALGGGFGGYAGRAAGRIQNERKLLDTARETYARELLRKQGGKQIGDPSDLYDLAKPIMDQKALAHVQQTSTPLTGPAMTQALKDTAEELGVSLRRLRAAETSKRGSVFNYSNATAEDLITKNSEKWVPESISRAPMGWVNDWYSKGVQPITTRARNLVGEEFSGKLQRYATKLAIEGDKVSEVFHHPTVKAFQKVLREDKDGSLRASILNMSNLSADQIERQAHYQMAKKLTFNRGGQEAVDGFDNLRKLMKAQQEHTKKHVNAVMPIDEYYWPAQAKQTQTALPGQGKTRAQKQANLLDQKRGIVSGEEALVIYESPDVVLDNAVRKSRGVSLMHEEFGLRNIGAAMDQQAKQQGKQGARYTATRRATASGVGSLKEVVKRVEMEGASEGTAQMARNLLESVAVNGSKGPHTVLANFRKAAYMGTIGNPYSAILNVGDVFNSMVNFGADETVDAMASALRRKGFEVGVNDVGLMHQTSGEFIRDGVGAATRRFNNWSEASFKLSGFTSVDRFGKNVAMNAALRNNRQLAAKGYDKFAERWGFAFDPTDLRRLHSDVLNGNKSTLVKELAAAELTKLQPTDLASMPQWFLDHPNARVLYMLRTFGLKQIQQMENLIFNQWKAGNKKEAIKNFFAYTMIVGGGNAMVNEGRQGLKGDMPTAEGVGTKFMDHMLGAATANTVSLYALERSVNEKNPTHLVSGAAPPIGLVFAPLIDLGNIAQAEDIDMKEALADSEMFGWLPWGRLAQQWIPEEDD